jgi:hypothetical protein
MRKLAKTVLAIVVLAGLSFGCAGMKEAINVKCPKCGATFTTEQQSYWKDRGW